MKSNLLLFVFFLCCWFSSYSQSIADAHLQPPGNTVTVTGIALNGPELGTVRYIQDATGGIALYDASLGSINRGDEVTVTGVLADYYNLLEVTTVSSFAINSSGNVIPAPLVLNPSQAGENNESELIRIDNLTFVNGGSLFAANTNYDFYANGQFGTVRIGPVSPLIGQTIPSIPVSVIGVCVQFLNFYQLIPRNQDDIFINTSISIVSQPVQVNITQSGFDVNWVTNIAGTSALKYGHTPFFELGILNGSAGIPHAINIAGASPADLFYVQTYSVAGGDTAFSDLKVFMTASASSGIIKAYFNRTVNNSVASPAGNLAVRLNNKIADTLAAYIDRAQFSLDIAIYTFDNGATSAVSLAINNAYNRGVSIRVIADGGNMNDGLATLNAAIPVLLSPTGINYTIMHNKFVVIDANAPDANLPVVWTGSTNWSNEQLNTDANNVIILQDQSLAKTYTIEFNEMWGSTGSLPNALFSRFGSFKTDNTPHEFLIGGKWVECYFSPSDNVNDKIIKTVSSADNSLYFAVFAATRYDIAYPVADRVNAGVYTAGMVDDSSGSGGSFFSIIYNAIGSRMMEYDHGALPGILHHKYMIIDQENSSSDPLVLTGSHNWSTNATTLNDENTVVVHDPMIANQYYQEFYQRYVDNGGIGLGGNELNGGAEEISIGPNPASGMLHVYFTAPNPEMKSLRIADITGKEIFRMNVAGKNMQHQISIPVQNFAPGLYFLEVESGRGTTCRKIIIQN